MTMDNSIYYRNKPIRDINPNQTMYSLIKDIAVHIEETNISVDKITVK